MSTFIDVRELPNRFDEALASAAAGDDVLLTDGQKPRARLVPLPVPQQPVPELHPGALQPAPDFDAPLPEEFWAEGS